MLLTATFSPSANAVIPTVPADGTVSIEQIAAAIEAIQAREDLDEESRAPILEQLRDAQAQVQNRQALEQAAAGFAAVIDTAPVEIADLTADLNQPPPPDPTPENLGVGEDTELRELERILTREDATLDSTEARLAQIEADIQTGEARPAEARARIDELRTAIGDLERSLTEMPAGDEQTDLARAQRLATELRLRARRAELDKLDRELESQAIRMELLRVQRDVSARAQAQQQQRVALLTAIVNEARQSSAEAAQTAALEVEQAYVDSHPAVREVAAGNAELTRELPTIAQDIAAATEALDVTNTQSADLERRLARAEQRLQIAGISQAIGQLLVEERRSLPRVSQYRSAVRDRRNTLSEIGLAQLRLDEQRRTLTPISQTVSRIMEDVALDVDDPTELEEIQEQVRTLLISRRDLLQQAVQSNASYVTVLSDLDVAQRRLLDTADDYKEFLDQNLLWIPSSEPVGLDSLRDTGRSLVWALSPTAWKNTVVALYDSIRDRAGLGIVLVLLLAALVALRPNLLQRQKAINERVGRLSTDKIGLTLQALLIVVLRVLPLPLAVMFAGYALQHGPDQSPFTLSVAAALLAVAPFLYNTTLFRQFCEASGVAEAESMEQLLRRVRAETAHDL